MKKDNLRIQVSGDFIKNIIGALDERGESLTPRLVAALNREIHTRIEPLLTKTEFDKMLGVIYREMASKYTTNASATQDLTSTTADNTTIKSATDQSPAVAKSGSANVDLDQSA